MDEKIKRLAEILSKADRDALCVASAVTEIDTLEVIGNALAELAVLSIALDKKDTIEGLVSILDDVADRIEAAQEHLERHVMVEDEIAHTEIPDNVASLFGE